MGQIRTCIFVVSVFLFEFSNGNHSKTSTCSQSDRQHIYKAFKSVYCAPRNTLVPASEIVTHFPSNAVIRPSYVSLKKCTGYCSLQKCISKETRTKVVKFSIDTSTISQCMKITVHEDTMCECGCLTSDRDNCAMDPLRKFDKRSCNCVCKGRPRQCTEHMAWDVETCKCVCREEKECSTGYEWISKKCKCMMVIDGV